jgi:GAF domain-containing protein
MNKQKKKTKFSYKLLDVSNLLEKTSNLEETLQEIASISAQILDAHRCSIMLVTKSEHKKNGESYIQVFNHYGNLPPSAYQEVTKLNNGIAGHVAATGQPLLTKDIRKSPFSSVARYPKTENPSLISAPIIMAKKVVGVINVSGAIHKTCFDEEDLELLKLFADYAAKSFHVVQLQGILQSRFLEMAVVKELEEKQAEESITINPDPVRFSKLVAKSFFGELTKAGFGPNQIIAIATEVLNLLQNTLEKHKQRINRED